MTKAFTGQTFNNDRTWQVLSGAKHGLNLALPTLMKFARAGLNMSNELTKLVCNSANLQEQLRQRCSRAVNIPNGLQHSAQFEAMFDNC